MEGFVKRLKIRRDVKRYYIVLENRNKSKVSSPLTVLLGVKFRIP
jgi:hypothetical protein